jgi:hypothetical protein
MKLANTMMIPHSARPQASQCPMLLRRGSWLHASDGCWQMHSVLGPLEAHSSENPLPLDREGREYFHVTTASKEKLVVSRAKGDRGMRELRLESVLVADLEPLQALLSA